MTSDYQGRDSYFRLRKIQDLCSSASTYSSILIVGGLDGAQNRASQAVLKYLFLGQSGQDLLGEQVLDEACDALEDTVLFITYSTVSIYYNPEAANVVDPIISRWKNVLEYQLPQSLLDDATQWENTKIQSFVEMVMGKCESEKIGLPVDSRDPMKAETWPLIQAYGVDNHQRGFFTMHHTVMDCASDLRQVLSLPDETSTKALIHHQSSLSRHWTEFLTHVDHVGHPDERLVKTEKDLVEDLASFYEFGIVRHAALGLSVRPTRGARVLLGTRSNDLIEPSDRVTAEFTGVGKFPAAHFIVEGEDPASGLRAGRTYFLASGKVAERIVDPDALVDQPDAGLEKFATEGDNSQDTALMKDVYCLLVKAMVDGTNIYVKEARTSPTETALHESMVEAVRASMKKNWRSIIGQQTYAGVTLEFLSDHLTIEASPFDASGEPTHLQPGDWNQVYLKMYIQNLPSQAMAGQSIGAAMVADTIVLKESLFHTVTNDIPYFRSWIQAGKEAAYAKSVEQALVSEYMLEGILKVGKEVGETLTVPHMLFDSNIWPSVPGTLRCFTHGFVFRSSHFNPIIVSFKENVASLTLVSTDYADLLLLIVDFENDLQSPVFKSFPIALSSTRVAIPFRSKAEDYSALMDILHTWKLSIQDLGLPFHRPFEDEKLDSALSGHFQQHGQHVVQGQAQAVDSSLYPKYIIPPHMPSLTSDWSSARKSSSTPVPITILVGVPGSDVQSVASSLMEVSSRNAEWTHVHVDASIVLGDSITPCLETLKSELIPAMENILAQEHAPKRPRILLSIIGFVDPLSIVWTLEDLQQSPSSLPLVVASVTACISAFNVYVLPSSKSFSNITVLPKVWDQLAAGVADHVVITRCADAPPEELRSIRYRIAKTNPDAEPFFLPSTGFETSGAIASLTSLDSFQSQDKRRYRAYLGLPSKDDGLDRRTLFISNNAQILEDLDVVRFRLDGPLDRTRFLTCVSALCPAAVLRSTTTASRSTALAAVSSPKLSGIRLAQALASTKVQEAQDRQAQLLKLADARTLAGTCGWVWSIDAGVEFVAESESSYEYLSAGKRASLRPAVGNRRQSQIIFSGRHLNRQALQTLVWSCFPTNYRSNAVRSLSDITQEEKAQLQLEHAHDALPSEYFYDGSAYVTFSGKRTQVHPNMESIMKDYLDTQNTQCEHDNAAAEKALQDTKELVHEF